MVLITDEFKEKNYSFFIKKLNQFNIDTTILEEKFGEKLKNATFNINNGGDGTFLHIIVRMLTPNAIKLSELNPFNTNPQELINFNKDSLIKVCLLMHISKVEMFQSGKREGTYEYAPNPYGMKMGLRSVALCNECNINLTTEEIEAMTILDRENDDQAKFFSSPLAQLVKIANELTFLHIKFI